MSENDLAQRIGHLKTVKSAFILEAQCLVHQDLPFLALPFYRRAADLELELAELFGSLDRPKDALISLFSACSCLVQARQFRTAVAILEQVVEKFPEAKEMLDECQGKSDEPLATETPAVQALADLLVSKGVITNDEWTTALRAI